MRLNKLLGTSVLSLSVLLGTSSLVYAQDRPDDAKPPQDSARPEPGKPPQDDAKPPRPDETKPQDMDKPGHPDKPAKQDDAKAAKQDEHDQKAQGKTQAGKIPDDKFRAHFGRQHTFVVNRPTVVEGHPRFQYGGYSFTIVDVWPVGWAYTDQCYIDYIDGEYFLFDLLHPGVRVALVVVL
jgi:hypothetical protein